MVKINPNKVVKLLEQKQYALIPKEFISWCEKTFKDDIDKIDIEHEYDSSLNISENQEEFKEKFHNAIDINSEALDSSILKEQVMALEEQKAYRENTAINGFKIESLFNKPKIIGLVGNSNEGKTNLIFYILSELSKKYNFSLSTYGLRIKYPNTKIIHSIEELEQIKNNIIILDEIFSLFDLDNRKIKNQIENTIRLIFHNNNILLLCGVGENFKKFLAAKLHAVIFKKITFRDLINGSAVKYIAMDYKGMEAGSKVLNLEINEALIYDGEHYYKLDIPYLKQFDTKKENKPILIKNVPKIVRKNNVKNNVEG